MLAIAWLLLLGPEPHIEWIGEACPGAAHEFERALADYVGPSAEAGFVSATLRTREIGGRGVRLTLTLASAVGEEQHDLEGLACEQLVDEAALLVAGVIDPFVYARPRERMRHELVPIQRPPTRASSPSDESMKIERPPEPELEPESKDEAIAVPHASDHPPIDRSRIPSHRVSGSLAASATSFVGLFPQIGGGFQLDGAASWGALRWHNAIAGHFGGRFRAGDADLGADLWAMNAATGLCATPGTSQIQLRACGLAGLGFVSARAVGTDTDRRSTRPWVQAGGELGVSVHARPQLAVVLGVGVLAALVRPSWAVQSPDASWMVPPVMGLVRLGIEISGLRRDQDAGR